MTTIDLCFLLSLLLVVVGRASGTVGHPEQHHGKTKKRLRNTFNVDTINTTTTFLQIDEPRDDYGLLAWERSLFEENDSLSSMSMSMEYDPRSPCVSEDVPMFTIDDNTNIGDTLLHPGPGFARKCGPDCYTVKDSGDDPPFDPELGDTLRFAYKRVTSNTFVMQSRVCGTVCDNGFESGGGQYGRVGLMVRDGLDPFGQARNLFVSHSPNAQADWSFRKEPNGETIFGADGSPDVPCLWITLERTGRNQFSFHYAYEDVIDPCEQLDGFLEHLSQDVSIEMPETVYVGLAVSTGVAPPFCLYTEADFRDIECKDC